MRFTFILTILVFGCAPGHISQATDVRPQRGLEYPPLPAGYEDLGGVLLDSRGDREYGLAQVAHGDERWLWLGQLTFLDSLGKAHWKLLATLRTPELRTNQRLVLGVCSRAGQPDPSLVAIAEAEDAESLSTIHQAWYANTAAGRFDSVAVAGIRCENEGYGA